MNWNNEGYNIFVVAHVKTDSLVVTQANFNHSFRIRFYAWEVDNPNCLKMDTTVAIWRKKETK